MKRLRLDTPSRDGNAPYTDAKGRKVVRNELGTRRADTKMTLHRLLMRMAVIGDALKAYPSDSKREWLEKELASTRREYDRVKGTK